MDKVKEIFIKRDCIYYDWGDSAPREYGAFCKAKQSGMTYTLCKKCKTYQKERRKEDRRTNG